MAAIDYEACYALLQVKFGAGMQDVNKKWRELSRVHHPDQYTRDPKKFQSAVEKQKQLNHARDSIKHWFELNPGVTPPRNSRSHHSNSRAKSQSQSSTEEFRQKTSNGKSTHSGQHAGSYTRSGSNESRKDTSEQSAGGTAKGATAWFTASPLILTPVQQLVLKIDTACSACPDDSPNFAALLFGFAVVFAPLWTFATILRLIFPELPGDSPDWLMVLLLGASGSVSWYIFRWFCAEAEIIKLQRNTVYFRTSKPIVNVTQCAKATIEKHTVPGAQWRFATNGTCHEAALAFEEELLPEMKRTRHVVIRFEARHLSVATMLALEVRVTSPLNSFTSRRIVDSVLNDLKKELQIVSAA